MSCWEEVNSAEENILGMQLIPEQLEASSSQLSGNTETYENVPRPPHN